MMKHYALFILVALLNACSYQYSVSTNLDKENIRQYFSPAKVKIYRNEQAFSGKYRYLAAVDGESCQIDSRHEPANEVDARTNARRNAFELGANAIVFTGCTLINTSESDKQCITTRVCYGKAYQLEQEQ